MKLKSVISAVLVLSLLLTMAFSFSGVASAVSFSQTYEAEDGIIMTNEDPSFPYATKLDASTKLQLDGRDYSLTPGFSGTGAVAMTNNPPESEDFVSFDVTVPATGRYDITLTSADIYTNEARKNALFVNGSFWDYFYSGESTWADDVITGVYLKSGANKIAVRRYITCDGNVYFDKLKVDYVSDASDFYNVEPVLSNPKANDTTKRLFSYLCDTYGENIISGQFSASGTAKEMKAIEGATGKTPAILGVDLMNYTSCYAHYLPNNVQNLKVTQNIIKWTKESNGIATVTWHWYAPYQYIKDDKWTSSFRKNSVYLKPTSSHPMHLSTKKIMNGEDEEGYNLLLKDVDMIAAQFKILQDNDVSVLFRPLHEAAGNETALSWFWWGQDKDAYIKLWKMVYDRLTDYHGLNNIIWVWNGQDPEWYPGDNYCDIVGWDVYPEKFDYTASSNRFWQATNYASQHNKIVALSENGTMPSIDQMLANNTLWSHFCTWEGEYVINNSSTFAENYTSKTELNKLYNSEKTITLDELPSNLYTSYPIGATSYTLTKSASDKFQNPYGGSVVNPDTDTNTDTDTDTNTDPARQPGDVNADGNIDIIDVALIRAHIVGTKTLVDNDLLYADMNGDGAADIIDVVMIRSAIVNK